MAVVEGRMMTPYLLALMAATLLAIAIILRSHARRRLAALDVEGEVIYWDGDWDSKVFVSHEHRLTGRPDYILKSAGSLVPVERKSRSLGPRKPHDGEILQLAAYCLLVEEHFGSTVRFGRLQYQDRCLDIAFNTELRQSVLTTLQELHDQSNQSDIARSHNPGNGTWLTCCCLQLMDTERDEHQRRGYSASPNG